MNVNSRIQKALWFLLVLCMVLQYVPMAGFAADGPEVVCICETDDENHATDCPLYSSTDAMAVPLEEMISGVCGDNLTWSLSNEGVLTISGTGDMWDYDLECYPSWASNKFSIKSCVIEEGVTTIGAFAFYDYTSLQNVEIANSVMFNLFILL